MDNQESDGNFLDTMMDAYYRSKEEASITLISDGLFRTYKTKVKRTVDDLFYISQLFYNDGRLYEYAYMEFKGSSMIHETTTKYRGRTRGRVGSALVGRALFGSVGAVVGASRSRRSKLKSKSITRQIELPGKGTVFLRDIYDGSIVRVYFNATYNEAINIERFFS